MHSNHSQRVNKWVAGVREYLFGRTKPIVTHDQRLDFETLEDRYVPSAVGLQNIVDNPNPTESDLFGYAVAAHGDMVAIGSKQDDAGAHNAGVVYLYNTTTNTIDRTIQNPFPGYADHFGDRLAWLGDDILVGNHYNDRNALNSGAVYLFDGQTGALKAEFYSPNPHENALFGYAVAAVGDKVLIGAHRDNTQGFEAGAAYLFDAKGHFLQAFYSPTPDAGDRFGIAVDAVGENILIGAHYDDTAAIDAGAAYLFNPSGQLLQTYFSPNAHAGDKFGYAVAGDGTRVLVGAFADDTSATNSGAAYLFNTSGLLLHSYASPTHQADAEFGWSVDFVGHDPFIVAPSDATNGAGAAYIYDDVTGKLLTTLANPSPSDSPTFGYSVSADGSNNIAVGAPRVNAILPNSGRAYVFGGTASLGGSVYSDLNNDGIRQTAEFGIAGATVTLSGTDGMGNPVFLTQRTDANGFYKFTDLLGGQYTLTETQATNFLDGKDRLGTAGGSVSANDQFIVTLTTGASGLKYNFGELRPASFAGSVYADANNNGSRDASEAGISGVTVTLTGTDDLGNAVQQTATTAADGSYLFSQLRPGTYTVRENQPSEWLDGSDTTGSAGEALSNDRVSGVVLAANAKVTGYDFGELRPANLGGSVYADANNNGSRDIGEAGISGVAVTLTGSDDLGNSVQQTATTATDGSYLFSQLRPGTYTVRESQPSGWLDGKDTAGSAGGVLTNDQVSSVSLASNTIATSYNFGELRPASLGGAVYSDVNNNGIRDISEVGISGVTVTLTGTDDLGNAVQLIATTAADGSYLVAQLRPGTYTVRASQPTGWIDGKDKVGSAGGVLANDQVSGVVLAANTLATGYNFGELRPASLGGAVYSDANNNGSRESSETGIPGVTVTLTGTDDLGNAVQQTATTVADGSYLFSLLRPGTYTVRESQPFGWLDGKDKVGSAGGVLANDQVSGVVLAANTLATGYHFGEVRQVNTLRGTTYKDLTGNGLSTDDQAMGGVSIKLYRDSNSNGVLDTADTLKATTTTAADGTYSFTNVATGRYFVKEIVPAEHVRTQPTLSDWYTVVVTSTSQSSGLDFANFQRCDMNAISSFYYLINDTVRVNDLTGRVREGDRVTAFFTIAPGYSNVTISLVSYTAPEPYFNAATANQQRVFNSATGVFSAGIHSLTVVVPRTFFQVDFIGGAVIDRLGVEGSNIFYTPQDRLIDADNGGTHPPV